MFLNTKFDVKISSSYCLIFVLLISWDPQLLSVRIFFLDHEAIFQPSLLMKLKMIIWPKPENNLLSEHKDGNL